MIQIPEETDTIFSTPGNRLYTYLVVQTNYGNNPVRYVRADSAGHACDYVCKTCWIARINLRANLVRE